MWLMAAAQFLKTRISLEEKQRVQALASQLLITDSVWLKRLVMRALGESAASLPAAIVDQRESERPTRDARLYVRLRPRTGFSCGNAQRVAEWHPPPMRRFWCVPTSAA